MSERPCPQCGELLASQRRQTADSVVTVDVCTSGDGVFVGEGEIEQLTVGRELYPLLLEDLGTDAGAPRLECPQCNEIMGTEVLELEAEDVEVDVCTVCHGIWLSQGELTALRDIASSQPELREDEVASIWDEEMPDLDRRERLGRLLGTLSRE